MDCWDTSKRCAPRTVLAGGAVALALLCSTPAGARADVLCQERARPVASVLVLHGGAWQSGSAADVHDLCIALARMGYRARSLDYPLGTVPGSYEYADAAAREETARGLPVYGLGISAGGTIAEYLAARSHLDGAVAIAPLSDFVNWRPLTDGYWGRLNMTAEMRRRLSPINNVTAPARMRLIHSPQDHLVPYEQSVRMVSRCGAACELVTLRMGLGHLSVGSREPALQWFAAAARRLPRRVSARAEPPPVISDVIFAPRSFVVARRSAHRVGRRGARRGTVLSYTLSAAARVRFTIEREPGLGRVATLLYQGAAGRNRRTFDGWIGRRRLAPASYRGTLSALSATGSWSLPTTARFRVRAPKR